MDIEKKIRAILKYVEDKLDVVEALPKDVGWYTFDEFKYPRRKTDNGPVTVTNFNKKGEITSCYFFPFDKLQVRYFGRESTDCRWAKFAQSYIKNHSHIKPIIKTVLIIPNLRKVFIYNQTTDDEVQELASKLINKQV